MRQRGSLKYSRNNRRIRRNVPPLCHSGLERKRSGGIHHVAEKYQRKVKSATREDSSTPFHYARNDIIGGRFRFIHRGCDCNVTERPMCRSARESTELLPKIPDTSPPYVIPTAAQAEWRNPPRGRKVPTQSKICYLGGFLDLLRSLGMTCRGAFPFVHTGYNCNAAERHAGRSLHTLPDGSK